MRISKLVLCTILAAHPATSWAKAGEAVRPAVERRLSGLTPDEARTLVRNLVTAQRNLKTDKFQSFELLAGSIASYDKTKVPPRTVFLSIDFERVWAIERVATDNRLWQPFKLAYAPDGLGKRYWDIEVVTGAEGDIERVLMIYKPPAPF